MKIFRKQYRLMAPEGDGGAGGGAGDAAAAAAAAEASAAAAAAEAAKGAAGGVSDAAAVAAAAAAATKDAAKDAVANGDSLLKPPPKGDAAKPGQGAGDGPAWLTKVPEKSRVLGADGKPDAEATLAKLGESYTNLEKLKGPAVPATPSDYTFQPPDKFKDMAFDDAMSTGFRERAHKAGISQQQYEFVMGEYLELVPQVLDATLKLTAEEARTALSKVWATPTEFEAGLSNAQRAVDNAPAAIRDDVWARFGRDPAFLQFAASMGKEMKEDKSVQNADGGSGGPSPVDALMASKAYRDPKDPAHATVSAQVQAHFKRVNGNAPAH